MYILLPVVKGQANLPTIKNPRKFLNGVIKLTPMLVLKNKGRHRNSVC